MGFLWDLVQQRQISTEQQLSATLEQRVATLESELRRTQAPAANLVLPMTLRFVRVASGNKTRAPALYGESCPLHVVRSLQ